MFGISGVISYHILYLHESNPKGQIHVLQRRPLCLKGHLNHYNLSLSLCLCVLDDNRISMLSWNHAANLRTDWVRQFAWKKTT